MRTRFLSAVLSATFMLWAAAATAGAWLPKPGQFYSAFTAERWVTDQARDASGDKGPISGDYQIERRALASYNEIGWKDRMSVVLGVPFQSETFRLGRPTHGEETSTGLGDLLFGVRYGLLGGGSQVVSLEADWEAPLGYDRQATPALGDGQQKVGVAALYGASVPSLQGFFEASGGVKYLAEDEETQVTMGAGAGFWVSERVLLGGTYEGASADAASMHVAGPLVVLRLDDRMDVFAGSRHTIAGENVVDVNAFRFGIAFKKTDLNRLQGTLGGAARP